jgi:hypothetical protein
MPEEMPLSRLLFRYVWPFWLFKDASRGDRYARAAAYRHNRSMRAHLPGYLMRWLFGCGATLAITLGFSSLSSAPGRLDVFGLLAAGWGIAFACSLCVLFTTSYIYLYLSQQES